MATSLCAFEIKRTEILHNLDLVNGDFRLDEIKNEWNNIKKNIVYETTIIITVSSGFYVRQFCRDLCNKMNVCGVISKLHRIGFEEN